MKCSLGISNFLGEISSLSHLLFSSIYLHWLLRKAFLSLLAILWNSAFRWVYPFFSPLPFMSLHFTAICKASSGNHFAFLYFLFLGMVLITASCTMFLWLDWVYTFGKITDVKCPLLHQRYILQHRLSLLMLTLITCLRSMSVFPTLKLLLSPPPYFTLWKELLEVHS